MYFIGEADDLANSVIERFSILNKSWEVLIDDISFSVYCFTLLSTGLILLKDSGNVVALYKPSTNELLDVSVDGTLVEDSYLVEYDNKCFELIWYKSHVSRLVCDLDSDRPTMEIAEATEEETAAILDMDFGQEFTFDKRKLGLVKLPCKC